MQTFSAIAFLGALAIFMFGIRISRIGVQLLAGDRLRELVASLTNNRFTALLIGTLVTLILQSSTATTVMLVGFANTGIMTLSQAMGVILGADIGTTFVVVLLSIRSLSDYALLLLVIGVALDIFSKRKRSRYISMVLMGFGFVFFGMRLMIEASSPLKESHLLAEIFSILGDYPLYAFFAAAGFTALVQNSATTLGLVMACAFSGLLDLKETIPIVLGANVGTCAGSLLQSIGSGPKAKQVAFAHLFLKITGATLALVFLNPLAEVIGTACAHFPILYNSTASQVAITHVGFNLVLAVLFLPFIRQGAWLIQRLLPEPFRPEEKPFGPKYLDPKSLDTPALAFANARREILRMAEIAQEMFRNTLAVFERDDREMMNFIEEQDDKVDILDREIKFYLAKLSQENLTSEQARMQLNHVAITSDLEEICDVINKNILELAEKKIQKSRHFSEAGGKEIVDFHMKVQENFQLAISVLTVEDEAIVRKVLRHEKHLAEIEDHYRQAHLQRLHKGMKEAIETSSIHLDLLSNLRRINSKLTAIVRAAFPEKSL